MAACLSGLAGYVDAIGFITLGGYFIAFMSGNSTRFAVGMAEGISGAWLALGLIGNFVVGVIAGTLTGYWLQARRYSAVLSLVSLLLSAAATLFALGHYALAITAMTLAMGAENAVFEKEGEVHIGLTYMTGALVKFGQRLAGALLGGPRNAWIPYLLLWIGLVAGAVVGALMHAAIGPAGALAIAAISSWIITLVAARIDKPTHT